MTQPFCYDSTIKETSLLNYAYLYMEDDSNFNVLTLHLYLENSFMLKLMKEVRIGLLKVTECVTDII